MKSGIFSRDGWSRWAAVALTTLVGMYSTPAAAEHDGKGVETEGKACPQSCAAGHECIDGHCQGANHPKDQAFVGRLKMQTKCAYGSFDCNVCVDDVSTRFNQLRDGFDTDANVYSFKWHDPCMTNPSTSCFAWNTSDDWHFQSVMRFAESKTDGSWLVATRSLPKSQGRIGIIRMGNFNGSPLPWRGQTLQQEGANKVVAWTRVGQLQEGFLNHASGAQMLGKVLFTGVECHDDIPECKGKNALVRIVDLSNPESPVARSFVAVNRVAADASAARLQDGYLLVVHAQDSDDDRLAFYRSDELDTGWTRIGVWHYELMKGIDDNFGCSFDTYQNMHLVTQCDGKLFLVGMCLDHGFDSDWADLYRIDGFTHHAKRNLGVPSITKVGKKKFGAAHGASFAYGGGVYVDPEHRMSIYAIGATTQPDNSTVFVNEFSAKPK